MQAAGLRDRARLAPLTIFFVLCAHTAQGHDVAPGTPPASGPGTESRLPMPEPASLLVLIRTTLIALNQGVQTGNFTVLRDLGAPLFQKTVKPADLGRAFENLRNSGVDLSAVVAVTPELREPPQITPENLLRLVGSFPSGGRTVSFKLLFQPVEEQWRLFAIAVDLEALPPAAPEPMPDNPAERLRPSLGE